MKSLTYEEKLRLFKAGAYMFEVPGWLHYAWRDPEWIEHIDQHGIWCPSLIKSSTQQEAV